jgi:polyhydroxyalkanoate synthase subunit PhaC
MAAGNDRRVTSVTLFTTLLDFADVGDISVFIDDEQLKLADEHMKRLGYLEGRHMSEAFNLLRENDLVWFFVVNNYLLGRDPSAFDILYWNSDSTRMPVTMQSFYLRNMYHRNVLKDPGGSTLQTCRSICGRSRSRSTFYQRAMTISRPGIRPTLERSWYQGRFASCSVPQDTSPA